MLIKSFYSINSVRAQTKIEVCLKVDLSNILGANLKITVQPLQQASAVRWTWQRFSKSQLRPDGSLQCHFEGFNLQRLKPNMSFLRISAFNNSHYVAWTDHLPPNMLTVLSQQSFSFHTVNLQRLKKKKTGRGKGKTKLLLTNGGN